MNSEQELSEEDQDSNNKTQYISKGHYCKEGKDRPTTTTT
jgi:hypothetical protein